MKRAAEVLASAMENTGILAALEKFDRANNLRVLTYHRIDEPGREPDLDSGLISATPEEFRQQMQLIASRYNPVSVDTVLAAQRGDTRLPEGAVLITFDDGYLDFKANAWPVLRQLRLPAVVFVPTAFPDPAGKEGFWWDRLHGALRRCEEERGFLPDPGDFHPPGPRSLRSVLSACKRRIKAAPHEEAMAWLQTMLDQLPRTPPLHRVMSWDDLRELADQGLAVCSHGHSHALCTRLSRESLRDDLARCWARLEQEIGTSARPNVLAWPANACDQSALAVAGEIGFNLGFGGIRGIADIPTSAPLHIMRIPINRYSTALFRSQLRPSVACLGRWTVDNKRRWPVAVTQG